LAGGGAVATAVLVPLDISLFFVAGFGHLSRRTFWKLFDCKISPLNSIKNHTATGKKRKYSWVDENQ
jgi:hypothetical protein